jgi:hypothetical protein
MLAVYADPLVVEMDCPVEGRSSGFESGWQGVSAFSGDEFWEIFSSLVVKKGDTTQDRPVAQYDLSKTEPTWTLSLRAKKTIPRVALTQSIQFDAGESKVHALGEFTAVSNVFQQYFSADRPIHIETIEVRDSKDALVESRWQQVAPETKPEQYLVFFKNPVNGTYTITVRGFFETDIREERPLQIVPVLTFDDVQTADHSINFFRTSAVIAKLSSSEESGWSKSDVSPSAPESFAQSIPIGTWRRPMFTDSLSESISPETLSDDTPKTGTRTTEPLRFALSPNHPKVKGKTVLTLQPVDSGEHWTMTVNFDGNVTSGELK